MHEPCPFPRLLCPSVQDRVDDPHSGILSCSHSFSLCDELLLPFIVPVSVHSPDRHHLLFFYWALSPISSCFSLSFPDRPASTVSCAILRLGYSGTAVRGFPVLSCHWSHPSREPVWYHRGAKKGKKENRFFFWSLRRFGHIPVPREGHWSGRWSL